MDDWKVVDRRRYNINKAMVPSLLKKPYVHLYPSNTETSPNLQADIFPLDPSHMWQTLPDATNEQPEMYRTVCDVFSLIC